MNKFRLFLLSMLGIVGYANAQTTIPPVDIIPVKYVEIKYYGSELPYELKKRKMDYANIPDNYLRLVMQTVEHKTYWDSKVDEAVKTLLGYVRNDSLQDMLFYIRNYIRHTREFENALSILNEKLKDTTFVFIRGSEIKLHPELQIFYDYIVGDSNYQWLQKISRDSIALEIFNASGNAVRFWINNKKESFHRFWATNNEDELIGTWIQVLPEEYKIRLLFDNDVYQYKGIENYAGAIKNSEIENEYLQTIREVEKWNVGSLYRKYWKTFYEFEGTFGQSALVNWSKGGNNSLSTLLRWRPNLNYNRNKTSWENYFNYRLGFIKSGSSKIRKNEDIFELNSKLGQRAFNSWFYTVQLKLETQLFKSYQYNSDDEKTLVAQFLSPGYLTLAVGMDYKPHSQLSLLLSPIAGKMAFVIDSTAINPRRYGIDSGKKKKIDAGARFELKNTFRLFKPVDVKNEIILYSSYFNSEERFLCDWKMQTNFRINYFLQTSIYMNLVYDPEATKKIQFKENINIGLNFLF